MLERNSFLIVTALLCASVLLVARPAATQSFYGSLVSIVRDAGGGVIPAATIVLTNNATGEHRRGVTAADGEHRFVNLVPGSYRLEVEASGFKRYVRDQIEVNILSQLRIDVALQLESLAAAVVVTGASPVLQTENASVGIVVSSRPVQELPLNGRNVLNLISLAPAVVPQAGTEGSLTGKNVFAGGNFQIGGGTANQSAVYFDGVPVQDSAYGNIVVLTPSPESVAEFRVQTNNSSAEFGRFTGGVINIASRSGTNALRGSLFEFHRNEALNSNTFFGEQAGLDKPHFVQNNFGGSLGGPLFKDKLFFFGNYEGYRNREGVLFRHTVPTAAMTRGDFSDYRNIATGGVVPIYDPWTQCGINHPGTGQYNGDCGSVPNRLQFPGNIIPADRISPITRRLLDFPIYGAPTAPGRWTPNNFERNASIGGNNDQYNIRVDYNLSPNQRILSRFTRWESTNLPVDLYGNGQIYGDPYSAEHFITTQVMVVHTHTFNSSMLLDVRFGLTRWDYDRSPGNLGIDLVSTFGLPQTPYGEISERSGITGMETIPLIEAGQNQFINSSLIYADDDTYSITPTLTKVLGGHTLKAGANLLYGDVDYFQNNTPGGTFTFSSAPTALDGTNPGATGDPFASFLIGQPTGGTYQSSSFTYGRSRYQAYFAEDSWDLNSRLTLNLGLRLEKPGAYYETEDRLATFNPATIHPILAGQTNSMTGQPYVGAFELVASDTQPQRPLRKNPLQFAPRVGVAYRMTDHTVLRAGGGTFFVPSTVRFFDGPTGNPVNQRVNNIVTSVDNSRTFFADMSNPFPSGVENYPGRDPSFQQVLLGGTGAQFYRDEEGYPGRSQQFNVALQHEFANQLSIEVAYLGLRGSHLPNTLNMNQLGREHIDRAANDATVCSLTGNVIIPQGQPGYTSTQRDTCYGAYLRQLVSNPFIGLIREGALSTPTVQRALLLVPFPHYTSATRRGYSGETRYDALQLRADKRFGSGSLISANYTFSRNFGNVETVTPWLDAAAGNPVAGYQTNNLEQEMARSSFDVPHRVVVNYVVDLPFGDGRRYGAGTTGLTRALISGWSLNGVTTLQSGYPLAFTATPNLIGLGYALRPNVDPNCDKKVSGSAADRLNRWFNTECFSVPNAGFVAADPAADPSLRWKLGNATRTDPDLRAHGVHHWNLALAKVTRIGDRVNLTFRVEAFNLFNRVQFGPPNTQASTAANNTFGSVTTQVNQPRLMQLAVRMTF
jgi:Carboxypeptidase regulatory-like domain/TonB-dependent Receptor Plug Domain